MKRSRKFPKRYAIYAVAVIYLFCDLIWLKGPISRKVAYRKNTELRSRQAIKEGRWVANVNTHPLTRQQLDLSTRVYLYRRGENADTMSESNLRITRRAVMQQLINDELVRQYAKAEKFQADPEAVKRRLAEFKSQFANPEYMQQRMAAQQLDEQQLSELIQQHVTQQLWLEKRISPATQITEQQARDWFEKNRKLENAHGFNIPEVIRARHIFISTIEANGEQQKTLIDDLHRKLTREELDFGKLARQYSEDERSKKHGGDLGWFSRERMPADFIKQVFPLPQNQISAPFHTKLGWHIVEVTDKKAARDLSFEELQPEITAWLKNRRSKEVLQIFLLKLRKASNIVIYPENM